MKELSDKNSALFLLCGSVRFRPIAPRERGIIKAERRCGNEDIHRRACDNERAHQSDIFAVHKQDSAPKDTCAARSRRLRARRSGVAHRDDTHKQLRRGAGGDAREACGHLGGDNSGLPARELFGVFKAAVFIRADGGDIRRVLLYADKPNAQQDNVYEKLRHVLRHIAAGHRDMLGYAVRYDSDIRNGTAAESGGAQEIPRAVHTRQIRDNAARHRGHGKLPERQLYGAAGSDIPLRRYVQAVRA